MPILRKIIFYGFMILFLLSFLPFYSYSVGENYSLLITEFLYFIFFKTAVPIIGVHDIYGQVNNLLTYYLVFTPLRQGLEPELSPLQNFIVYMCTSKFCMLTSGVTNYILLLTSIVLWLKRFRIIWVITFLNVCIQPLVTTVDMVFLFTKLGINPPPVPLNVILLGVGLSIIISIILAALLLTVRKEFFSDNT